MDLSTKEQAPASHDVFRKLAVEHSQYAQRLDALAEKRYLSEEEKLEEVRLKKLKLKLKDQMALLEHGFTQSSGAA
jgi:uncharacterized protein YdcH (DUF465 family)